MRALSHCSRNSCPPTVSVKELASVQCILSHAMDAMPGLAGGPEEGGGPVMALASKKFIVSAQRSIPFPLTQASVDTGR